MNTIIIIVIIVHIIGILSYHNLINRSNCFNPSEESAATRLYFLLLFLHNQKTNLTSDIRSRLFCKHKSVN